MKVLDIHDTNYPPNLLNIKNPPAKLYVEGNEKLLQQDSIAIVGSRQCTEYGIKYAQQFAEVLADSGITIISGMALGIDSIAHKAAIKFPSSTIAVLGSGFNHIYPSENSKLFTEIIEKGGCIISEYPPEAEVDMKNFPFRNRIISALSMGILVVEANYRSGSTITARYGFEQNKPVFCLPRNIGISHGIGTNKLIQQGAMLVTNPQDILEVLQIKPASGSVKNIVETVENLPPESLQNVYNSILYTPIHISQILDKTKLNISILNQQLFMLELEGFIKSLPGNYYARASE